MTFQQGDKVRVKGRHGVMVIRGPFRGGRYAGLGFWVWSNKLGRVIPASTSDIRSLR